MTTLKDELKDKLVQIVTNVNGCKATELAASREYGEWLVSVGGAKRRQELSFVECVQELINEGRLIEVEYSLPTMDYRAKSFLLPKDTEVRVCTNMMTIPIRL